MEKEDFLFRIDFGNRLQIIGLVVYKSDDAIARLLKMADSRGLHLLDILVLLKRTHIQKFVRKLDSVFFAQLIQRPEGVIPHGFGSSCVQPDKGVGLKLKPPNDLQNPRKRMVCVKDILWQPAMLIIPVDNFSLRLWGNLKVFQKMIHLIFVYGDIGKLKLLEEMRFVLFIESLQNVKHHIAHIQNRTVDVKHDHQLVFRI